MKQLVLICLIFLWAILLDAQVGIGTTNPQSALDIQSDSMGLTVPRVASIQDVVRSKDDVLPQSGTIVFNLADNCFWGFDGTVWRKFGMSTEFVEPVSSPGDTLQPITEAVVLSYFPSWQENFPTGNGSKLRNIPLHITHVFLGFAKPNLTYVKGSYDITDTGIEVPYDGCVLANSIAIAKEKGQKILLSIGGETYWQSAEAFNINYPQVKDLVDDMGFEGIDWDFEPNGSFSDIGTPINVNQFITFFEASRAIMPKGQYILACAPSGVGCLGGVNNDDPGSPFAYAQRNTLTGESDANLYQATVPNNGISLFGFSATGHMIPVIDSVGDKIDLIAIQNYNVGAATNRKIMYDAYAHYADTYGFLVAAGTHFPNEPWGPYYTFTEENVASQSKHIYNSNLVSGRLDGIMIWQALLADANSSSYSYMNVASQVLAGVDSAVAVSLADNWSLNTYSGTVTVNCSGGTGGGNTYCQRPEYDLATEYPMADTEVYYECAIWKNNWWANPGEYPGNPTQPTQWTQLSVCNEGPTCP